jgi:hypothetical protein
MGPLEPGPSGNIGFLTEISCFFHDGSFPRPVGMGTDLH